MSHYPDPAPNEENMNAKLTGKFLDLVRFKTNLVQEHYVASWLGSALKTCEKESQFGKKNEEVLRGVTLLCLNEKVEEILDGSPSG